MDNNQNIATNENAMDALALAQEIVKVLDANKAGQIKLLRVNDQTVMTDYFVICTGNSNTHIKSLCGEVEFKLGEQGARPLGTDGYDSGIWIVMDYESVMVHIFNREQRDFFKLEKLWADAEDVSIENIVTEN